MRYPILMGLILCWPVVARGFDATDRYERREVEGWAIFVHKDLLADEQLAGQCLALLRVKLFDVGRVVPAAAAARLREVPIWLELNDPKFPCACYHPSKGWLVGHDVNPEKTGAVEISNARNFLAWSIDQPFMVLHELAHAYHQRVLGYDYPAIKAAYAAAKASGKYEHVLQIRGETERHYGMNNDQEYFAESSEAFFGTNDFYPFVRAELKEFDPQMEAVVREAWGAGRGKAAATTRPATVPSGGGGGPPATGR